MDIRQLWRLEGLWLLRRFSDVGVTFGEVDSAVASVLCFAFVCIVNNGGES